MVGNRIVLLMLIWFWLRYYFVVLFGWESKMKINKMGALINTNICLFVFNDDHEILFMFMKYYTDVSLHSKNP